jgi:hypothetical protein
MNDRILLLEKLFSAVKDWQSDPSWIHKDQINGMVKLIETCVNGKSNRSSN